MIYARSALAGLAALMILAALIICGFFLAPLVVERLAHPNEGGVGFYVNSPYVSIWQLVAGALCIFAVVSLWAFRRASRGAGRRS
jgi:hypothetical protein